MGDLKTPKEYFKINWPLVFMLTEPNCGIVDFDDMNQTRYQKSSDFEASVSLSDLLYYYFSANKTGMYQIYIREYE